MRVAHHVPATWRGRTLIAEATRLRLHERAVAASRRISDGADLLRGLRRVSAPVHTRVTKARSETQSPSALERLWEELVALHLAGATLQQLRLAVVETAHLLEDLVPVAGGQQAVLEAIHAANAASAAETDAESRLLTRADRALTVGDLERLEESTKSDIAAKQRQLTALARLRRELHLHRQLNRTFRTGVHA